MEKERCPICGLYNCKIKRVTWYRETNDLCAHEIECRYGLHFIVHESVDTGDRVEVQRRYNLIYEFLLQRLAKKEYEYNYPYKFFYEEETVGNPIEEPKKINLANEMRNYPQNIMERIDKSLMNLSRRHPLVGSSITTFFQDRCLFYCEGRNDLSIIETEMNGIWSFLKELEYAEEIQTSIFVITAKGWQRVHEMTKQEKEIRQGFIAMSFGKETSEIGKTFNEVIADCGYIPRRIDQKEHNNQIVPEIFFEIERSKFLVVDITYPNYGAYYEAGYGEALKKQVIVCCRRDKFDSNKKEEKPHFDIAQKSAVVWDDFDDLRKKLYHRIEATVGINK